jgi:LPXTG-motif cell wall-anchored protein
MLKKFVIFASVLALLALPKLALASEVVTEEIICPQPYGGGVVCGVKTHTVLDTGLADNLPLLGAGFILASGAFLYFSKRFKKLEL